MKKSMKLLLVITCSVLILSGCGKTKNSDVNINDMPDIKGNENVKTGDDGIKTNVSNALGKEKVFDNYKVTDSKLVSKDDKTFLTANIKNISHATTPGTLYDIIFVDKTGKQLSKMGLYIRELQAGELMATTVSIDKDMANAYDFILKKR